MWVFGAPETSSWLCVDGERESFASLRRSSCLSPPYARTLLVASSVLLNVFSLGPRQAPHSKHRCSWTSSDHIQSVPFLSLPPFLPPPSGQQERPSRRFQNPSSPLSEPSYTVCRMLSPHTYRTPTRRPFSGAFHSYGSTNRGLPCGLSMTPQRLGKTQTSLSFGLDWYLVTASLSPPMAADLCFITAPRHALIARRLRTRTAFNQYPKRVPPPSWDGALHGIIAQLALLFATAERDHSLGVTTSKYIIGYFKIITIHAQISFHRCSLFST